MLTSKQKSYLRSLAQTEPALFQIGKEGLSDNLIQTVDDALRTHELVKIKLLKTVSDDVDEMIANRFIVEYDALEKRIESFVMQSIKDNMNLTNNEI